MTKAEGRRQKAEGRRQKAEGRRKKGEGRRKKEEKQFNFFKLPIPMPQSQCPMPCLANAQCPITHYDYP